MAVFALYVCMRVKVENLVYFQMCDATKHQNIVFNGVFRLSNRIKLKNGIVIGC